MNRKLFWWASWTLNVALAWIGMRLARADATQARVTDSTVARPAVVTVAKRAAPAAQAHFSEQAPAADQRRWLVDELRAMGMPNHELAQFVLADLDAAWTKYSAAKAIECRGNPQTMAALQLQVDRARDAEMRAALGEAGFRQWDEENMRREIDRGNVTLSAAETSTSYEFWKNLQRRQLDLREARLKGDMDESEVSAALEKAVSQYTAQMKGLLGEERYAESQRPEPPPAEDSLRQELAGANPTALQFQTLLQTQQQWIQQRADIERQQQSDPNSPAYAEQLKALDDARDAAYRRVLGDDAFAALQKQQDAGYSNMKTHQQLWGLDDRTIDSVYGNLAYYQKTVADYQSQARALEAQGQTVDWSSVNRNLKQFTEQTQQSLRAMLGDTRYAQMQRNGVFTPLAQALPYARPNGNLDRTNTVSVH